MVVRKYFLSYQAKKNKISLFLFFQLDLVETKQLKIYLKFKYNSQLMIPL